MKNQKQRTGLAYNDLELVYEVLFELGEGKSFSSEKVYLAIHKLFPDFKNEEKVSLAIKTIEIIGLFSEEV
jgi:hypothetical protein